MAEISSTIKTSMVIGDHYEKIVVALDDFALPSKDGIKHVQVWNLSQVL